MQTLLFIKTKLTQADVEKIDAALSETRVDYRIKQPENCIIVDGRNDIVHAAKVTLRELGYEIE